MSSLKKLFLITTLLLTSFSVYARGAKVEKVEFNNRSGDEIEFSILMEKGFRGIPKLEVKKNILQVSIPESYVWPKVEKQVTVGKKFDTKIIAYQFNKDLVRFRAILPKSLENKKHLITLSMVGDKINLKLPKKIAANVSTPKIQRKVVKKKKADVSKYDESYLEKLFQDKLASETKDNKIIPKVETPVKREIAFNKDAPKPKVLASNTVEDKVAFKESSLKDENDFSVMNYIGKFVGFLALILLGFYGVVTLMRKGVLKKGKLGFLNSTKVIEVLNTTYIGPKRSISVIKAHNQVFLIGNSEKGIHFLSEIKDVAGLLKNGELDLSGSNFDTNLTTENTTEKEFNLKEVLTESAPMTPEKNSVKNQITAKIKNLKSLQ
jgi:flagellar biogenesis protein FliO